MEIEINFKYSYGDLDERFRDAENEEVYEWSESFDDIDKAIESLNDLKEELEEEASRLHRIPDEPPEEW